MFEECLNMGNITRIDFAPVHPGTRIVISLEECQTKSVFIHFEGLNQHEHLKQMYNCILGETPKAYKLELNYWFPNEFLKQFPKNIRYFMIMKAKSTIPNTYMNIHQIADALKKQELLNQKLIQFIAKHICKDNSEMLIELGNLTNTPPGDFTIENNA